MIKERYGIVDRDYRLMEVMVLKGAPHYAGKQWKFAGAFYYATTVLTTIGTANTIHILINCGAKRVNKWKKTTLFGWSTRFD